MVRATFLAVLMLGGCVTSAERTEADRPLRKGDPEPVYEFEAGPSAADTSALVVWLEANRGRRLRLPVAIELRETGRGIERARVGEVALHVTDLALGVPLIERVAQICGREAIRCELWLEGRMSQSAPFAEPRPQFQVLKVRERVDPTAAPPVVWVAHGRDRVRRPVRTYPGP